MAENKRYYWLKLNSDFFTSKRIKKLRRLAGGDTYTIIYLKMQLLSLGKGGLLEYTGLEETFYKELSLDLDEDEENIKVTVNYLISCGLLTTSDDIEYVLPFVQNNLGSETASTQRSRKSRQNKQNMLQSNTSATQCNNLQQNCNVDIDTEIEIDTDIDIDSCSVNETVKKKFIPPSVKEVREYCLSVGSQIDPESFVAFYESKNWMIGKNKMVSWKSAIVTWEKRNGLKRKPVTKPNVVIEEEQELSDEEWLEMMKNES